VNVSAFPPTASAGELSACQTAIGPGRRRLSPRFGGRRDEEARDERDRQQRGSSKSVGSGHDPLHAPLGALVTHLPNRRASRCGSFA